MLDSGASSHYIKQAHKFVSCEILKSLMRIITEKGPVYAVAWGDVLLNLFKGRISIKGVLLVPDLAGDADLLSVPALMKQGFEITFKNGSGEMRLNDVVWGRCQLMENSGPLCYLEEYHSVEDYALAMKCTNIQTLETWHMRLGHINSCSIKDMTDKVTGMKIGVPSARMGERNMDCVDCIKGTQHQIISRYPFTSAKRLLERVSLNFMGSMSVPDCT